MIMNAEHDAAGVKNPTVRSSNWQTDYEVVSICANGFKACGHQYF